METHQVPPLGWERECILELQFKLIELKVARARDGLVIARNRLFDDYRKQIAHMWTIDPSASSITAP